MKMTFEVCDLFKFVGVCDNIHSIREIVISLALLCLLTKLGHNITQNAVVNCY